MVGAMITSGPLRLPCLVPVLAGLLLAACGGGGEDPGPQGPVQAVSPDALAEVLPDEAGDWTRGVVTPHTQPSGEGQLTWVTTYMDSATSENTITVELLDCFHAPTLLTAFQIMFETRQPGYRKFAPGGHRAVEIYNRRPLNTNLEILVAGRFWLKLGGEGQDPLMMNEVLSAFDLDRIAKLAE